MGKIARRGQIWICNAFCWLKFFQDYFSSDPSACLYRSDPPPPPLPARAHCLRRILREHPLDVERTSLALLKSIDPVIYRVTALATSLWRLQPRKSIVGITSVPRSGYNARVCRVECSVVIEITRIAPSVLGRNEIAMCQLDHQVSWFIQRAFFAKCIWECLNFLSAKYSFYTYSDERSCCACWSL